MGGELRFFDRLRRTWSSEPPHTAFSSQFLVGGATALAHAPVGSTAILLDDGTDSVSVRAATTVRLSVFAAGDPGRSLDASEQVSAQLSELRQLEPGWRDVVGEVFPLIQVTDAHAAIEESQLESSFRSRLPQLRQVYLSPEGELRYDTERVPVARARRISRRATQVLAARTEDWERAGAAGVTPRVIESLVRDDSLDLYENRVAARMLDRLESWIHRKLGDYEGYYALAVQHHELVGWHWQMDRLARLWGSHPPDDDLFARLERRREDLRELARSCARLRNGPLYDAIPRRAQVPPSLHLTNRLREDPNYRAIPEVWAALRRAGKEDPTPIEIRDARLRQALAFADFAWVILAHALSGLEAGSPDNRGTGQAQPLARSVWGLVTLETVGPLEDMTWRLAGDVFRPPFQDADGHVLVIPLACEILASSEAGVESRLRSLEVAISAPDTNVPRIILYPGRGQELAQLPPHLQVLAHRCPPALEGSHGPETWVIPISPLDLASLERVERAIRWLVLSRALMRYPLLVRFPPSERSILSGFSFVRSGLPQEDIAVVGIASESERARLDATVRERVRELRLQPRQVGERAADSLQSATDALLTTSDELRIVTACPVCKSPEGGVHSPREASTYEVICSSCGTRWGLRHDPASARPVPYLWVPESPPSRTSGRDLVRWAGRDVLAEPCHHADVPYGTDVVNPWTGRCTASASRQSSCDRCQMDPLTGDTEGGRFERE